MRFPSAVALMLGSSVFAKAASKVYLCGDSTMTRNSGNIQGWGEYLQYSLPSTNFQVVNKAIGGRSARSFTREGRFDEVVSLLQSGDWAVIEFGHNDGGSLSNDNGRSDCFGDGAQTCETVYSGAREIVQTYPTYLKQAITKMLAKGAKVVISSPTPNNVWEGGRYAWGPGRFDYYSWLVASQLGGPSKGVYFVPHGEYSAQAMKNLGSQVVNANYPNDHTHTSPYLADVLSQAFVLGLKCGTSDLGRGVANSTLPTYLGSCVSGYNSTISALLR